MNYDAKIEVRENEMAEVVGNPLTGDLDQDRASRRRIWIVALVAVVLMVGIWFLLHRGGSDDAAGDASAQIPVVTVAVPGKTSIAGEINATGTLAARREMPVGSVGEGGEVRSVLVEPGDWVSQGQVLAIVDRSVQTQQQASQAAQVSVAQADARLAQANLDRALKLVDRGFISTADVDRLTATRDAAVARVKVAQATLGQLQAQAARLNIVAPAEGLVLERNVEPGQVVGGGSGVLFSIAKGGQMELLADLSEDDLAAISVGVPAEVTPVGSGKSFTGQVWQISPVIDPNSRQGTARIALSYDKALRPGGFASVKISRGTVVAPMLPEAAIQNDAKGSFVYVVDDKGIVHRRPVTTSLVTAQGIAVPSGLTGSEKVVLRAGGFLNDGDKVKPKLVTVGK
ncbi:efflux RND transporter periplasmic adaptor subunit [Novosphingobium mangrovi (ex Huang et al. 2023)]|uniref:Efflux RND transporter periplasmic adaptor subunit n=1 Tax=Novosphingobium mangrovi (ex Huang et al. 2023) TaxID=2976432 RepID=A0ABT2I8R6_9SPHN|nr:efflux RND transporter periplasmic adaptor subunit [Novosphingobium mangrovi (ex Huang et al. 2023)]MCT2401222.1 efflux RND transporter periplasmic adaptor subunit [Novosphingobium mangrovi (ex Huang et al. 2023)]